MSEDDTKNLNGTETCDAPECLNNYTPNRMGGKFYCVTHAPTFDRGEYVIGKHGGERDTLFRVTDAFFRAETETDRGREFAVVRTPLARGNDDDKHTIPTDNLAGAVDVDDGASDTWLKARPDYSARTSSGIRVDAGDDDCPICGCNARRWASDPDAGIGGEWCAACDFAFHEP